MVAIYALIFVAFLVWIIVAQGIGALAALAKNLLVIMATGSLLGLALAFLETWRH
jgi:hypothetical protein